MSNDLKVKPSDSDFEVMWKTNPSFRSLVSVTSSATVFHITMAIITLGLLGFMVFCGYKMYQEYHQEYLVSRVDRNKERPLEKEILVINFQNKTDFSVETIREAMLNAKPENMRFPANKAQSKILSRIAKSGIMPGSAKLRYYDCATPELFVDISSPNKKKEEIFIWKDRSIDHYRQSNRLTTHTIFRAVLFF